MACIIFELCDKTIIFPGKITPYNTQVCCVLHLSAPDSDWTHELHSATVCAEQLMATHSFALKSADASLGSGVLDVVLVPEV